MFSAKRKACALLDSLPSFELVFNLHLMRNILGITNGLSQALQLREQDIVNAITLIEISKKCLQIMRDSGWHSLLVEALAFYDKHKSSVPNMDATWEAQGWSCRRTHQMANI